MYWDTYCELSIKKLLPQRPDPWNVRSLLTFVLFTTDSGYPWNIRRGIQNILAQK